jgi:hypothetical protein
MGGHRHQVYVQKAIFLCDLRGESHKPIPLPDWCRAYLADEAARIAVLADKGPGRTDPDFEPLAFDLRRDLRRCHSRSMAQITLMMFTIIRFAAWHSGGSVVWHTYDEAIAAMAQTTGVHERSMKKRLRAARAAVGPTAIRK